MPLKEFDQICRFRIKIINYCSNYNKHFFLPKQNLGWCKKSFVESIKPVSNQILLKQPQFGWGNK